MKLGAKIFQNSFIWFSLGAFLTGCSLFGGDRPKPVERDEFDQLSGRVTKLEDVVLKAPPNPWASTGLGAAPPVPGAPIPSSPFSGAPATGLPDANLATPTTPSRQRASEWSRYQRALSQTRARRYAEATLAFETMLAENPQGSLAPNARYWLGECHYARGDYGRALNEFKRGFLDYPSSNKAPDYLLKMSYCQSRLGDGPGAMESTRILLDRYPDSNSARLVKSGRSRF